MRTFLAVVVCGLVTLAPVVRADPKDEAQKLKDEATAVLKANVNNRVSPEQYAGCIIKLEKAKALLEHAGDPQNPLLQEVNATLFWTRRMADVNILAAVDRMHAENGGAPDKAPPEKAAPKPDETAEPEAPLPKASLEARKAYEAAEHFAQAHSGDDYALGLRWFQVANEYPETDYGLKALAVARAAQQRYAQGKAAVVVELPAKPEFDLIKAGDALAAAGKCDDAITQYRLSLKTAETGLAYRRIGEAYFKRAQQMRDDLLASLPAAEEKVVKEWRAGFRERHFVRGGVNYTQYIPNVNYPPFLDALHQWKELCKKRIEMRPLYEKAESAYKSVLRLSPDQQDLDAAGHIGLCAAINEDPFARSQTRNYLREFLAKYTPCNDLERSLYGFCKTEYERLTK